MNTPFDKLNRLRKVAGQKPLKAWKASQDALQAQINRLENDGYTDPGPDPIAEDQPVPTPVDFGPDAKADTPPTAEEIPALNKLVAKEAPEPPKKKGPAQLARGIGDDKMGAHCRKAVQDQRAAEKKDKDSKKPKKSKIKKNKDGTAEKTTTSGKKRKLGKELVEKIEKQRKEKKQPSDPNNFTVADLARECDMDPKVARAKLRRHEDRIKKLHSKGQDRWTFPNAARKTLRDILCPSKK